MTDPLVLISPNVVFTSGKQTKTSETMLISFQTAELLGTSSFVSAPIIQTCANRKNKSGKLWEVAAERIQIQVLLGFPATDTLSSLNNTPPFSAVPLIQAKPTRTLRLLEAELGQSQISFSSHLPLKR
jgi:hypothetical protein